MARHVLRNIAGNSPFRLFLKKKKETSRDYNHYFNIEGKQIKKLKAEREREKKTQGGHGSLGSTLHCIVSLSATPPPSRTVTRPTPPSLPPSLPPHLCAG